MLDDFIFLAMLVVGAMSGASTCDASCANTMGGVTSYND